MVDSSSLTTGHPERIRQRIEKAKAEADDPATEWVDHATVEGDMEAQRERLRDRIKEGS